MNLECLNDIITSKLAIHIDLTNLKSWDLNTGFTSVSLTKWVGAVSDNINLIDFGLTEFDNGRTNVMWSGITLTPKDTQFSMYRVGYNAVQNPTSGETGGVTATTQYDLYPMSAITTGGTGNYFMLDGGYLQGFFNLEGYNYKLLPSRYNTGITIETLLYLQPDSQGIFFMMGTRAEDKYNPYFSGETMTGATSITGVTTSLGNYLEALMGTEVMKKSFEYPENSTTIVYSETPPINNIKGNAIAFEITQDKRLAYKYIDNNGLIVTNTSDVAINPTTGWTMIDIVFTPDNIIDDPALFLCAPQRMGKLIFYVNGRAIWILKNFPEFYFKSFTNDKEKQIGVPYSISWGGGSFGLKHSWHYDFQEYGLYTGQDTAYIKSKFFVLGDPLPTDCNPNPTNDYLPGLSLSADSSTFLVKDNCDSSIEYPFTVMRIEYTGETGTTTGKTYFIKFNQPISVLSNRNYEIDLSIFNDKFFKSSTNDGGVVNNKVSLLVYGTVDVGVVSETEYRYPLTSDMLANLQELGLHPYPDRQEYQYILNGVMYYGATGIPVLNAYAEIYGYSLYNLPINQNNGTIITGENSWKPLKTVFRTKDNTGQQFVYIGLLIETDYAFNINEPLFVTNFTYTGADVLVQDERKDNLLIEQNFNSSFIGGIQKLRIYDNALTSPEILHNAVMESKKNPELNILVSKGGRIIYR
mgnify:CR=1 FL=1